MAEVKPIKPIKQISLTGITKDFPGVRALDGVDLILRPGEIHALCGENGAGKSTLMKILSGLYPAGSFEGEIRIDGTPVTFRGIQDAERAGIAIIHQELALVGGMSVADNLFLGCEPFRRFGTLQKLDSFALHRESRKWLSEVGLSVPPETRVDTLGVGAQQLVEIAKALQKERSILILDEPTAALSETEAETLFGILERLRANGHTLVYISHKLPEVFRIADRLTVLRDGRTVKSAPIGEWTEEAVIREMVGRTLEERFPPREAPEDSVPLLVVEDLSVPPKLHEISVSVRKGEIVGVAGLMGAGRTELALALFGAGGKTEFLLDGKIVSIASPREAIEAGIVLLTEDRKRFGPVLDAPIESNLSLSILERLRKGWFIDEEAERLRTRAIAEELTLKAPSLEAPVGTLSGGNQQKVVLGKALLTEPKLLILDEPTRGIDVGAKW
ncbi:MAG: sugar ABC transporter ATP-binding protein, partial [Bacteroidota bacterium]